MSPHDFWPKLAGRRSIARPSRAGLSFGQLERGKDCRRLAWKLYAGEDWPPTSAEPARGL